MLDLKTQKPAKVKKNRRKRGKKARDWRKILHTALRLGIASGSLALIVSGIGVAGRLLFHSDYFRVASLKVENERRVSREEVLALSDIRLGANIFDLDLESIGRKIAEDPWVASARVQRVFPQEVVIRVTERIPRAVVNLGFLYYVDAGGEVFKVLESADSLDYPVITGIDRQFLVDSPEEARRLLRGAMALLERLEGRERFNLRQVSEVHIDPSGGYRVHTLVGAVPVHLGFDGFEGKLDRLERIYPQIEGRLAALKYIDLNVADRVIVKVDSRFTRKG